MKLLRKIINMAIQMTKAAIESGLKLQNENLEWKNKPLRVYLGGKGCDGFDYGVCFDQQDSDDKFFDFEGLKVVVDPDTLLVVQGAEIDWIDDERGQGFLVNNPNHDKFKGKFFRKKDWKERLL